MLNGQVALVTGASRGIGKAIALELGKQGAIVAGTATSEAGAQAIGAYLAAAQIKGAGFAMNVNDAAQVEATIAGVQKQCGEISILVNNFLQNVIEAKRKGSPVEFLALDPVISAAGLIGINRLAPHPNAARLFVDFVLSREGQELIVKTDRSSVRKDVGGNPLDLIKNVRIVPSDLSLGKNYVQTRDEYRDLLGVK